jgi:hypothetical protein
MGACWEVVQFVSVTEKLVDVVMQFDMLVTVQAVVNSVQVVTIAVPSVSVLRGGYHAALDISAKIGRESRIWNTAKERDRK